MKKTARKGPKRTGPNHGPLLPLTNAIVRRDLRELVGGAEMAAGGSCSSRSARPCVGCGTSTRPSVGPSAQLTRRASSRSAATYSRAAAKARTVDGSEVTLPSWRAFTSEDPLHDRTTGAGARRRVHPTIRAVAGGRAGGRTHAPRSRNAVSRRFVAATEQQMGTWLARHLGDIDLVILMTDGGHTDEHVVVPAPGSESDGKKHVLGIRDSATENVHGATARSAAARNAHRRLWDAAGSSPGRPKAFTARLADAGCAVPAARPHRLKCWPCASVDTNTSTGAPS